MKKLFLSFILFISALGMIYPDVNFDLLKACEKGDLDQVKKLLALKADINFKNREGETPLYTAIFNSRLEVAEYLLTLKPDINVRTRDGLNCLYIAVFRGHVKIIKILIEMGADVNTVIDYEKRSVLIAAIDFHDWETGTLHRYDLPPAEEIVALLIQKGADVNHFDDFGRTALMYACGRKLKNTVKLILDKNAKVQNSDIYGFTPLHFACESGAKEICEMLLSRGADINAQNLSGVTPFLSASMADNPDLIDMLLLKGADLKVTDKNKNTALHYASANGCIKTMAKLIEKGIDINARDNDGITALEEAVRKVKNIENTQTVDLLLKHNAVFYPDYDYGYTGLHDSREYYYKLAGFMRYDKDNCDFILNLALMHDNIKAVKELFNNGMSLNNYIKMYYSGSYSYTPLYIACKYGSLETAEFLIQNGANMNKKVQIDRFKEETPLQAAIDGKKINLNLIIMMLYYKPCLFDYIYLVPDQGAVYLNGCPDEIKEIFKPHIMDNYRYIPVNLKLRKTPEIKDGNEILTTDKNEIVMIIDTGKSAEIDGIKGSWVKVVTQDKKVGWCFDGYLIKILIEESGSY